MSTKKLKIKPPERVTIRTNTIMRKSILLIAVVGLMFSFTKTEAVTMSMPNCWCTKWTMIGGDCLERICRCSADDGTTVFIKEVTCIGPSLENTQD